MRCNLVGCNSYPSFSVICNQRVLFFGPPGTLTKLSDNSTNMFRSRIKTEAFQRLLILYFILANCYPLSTLMRGGGGGEKKRPNLRSKQLMLVDLRVYSPPHCCSLSIYPTNRISFYKG